ncbi:hypothetical protein ACJX0J_023615, partial [Zea mays]
MLVLISADWKRDRDSVVQFTKSVYMYIQYIFAFKYIHGLRFSGLEIGVNLEVGSNTTKQILQEFVLYNFV